MDWVIQRKIWYTNLMETVTISKAEYEELKAQKAHIADLLQRVDFLIAQMCLARHKQSRSSSEKSEHDQYRLFDETKAYAVEKAPEPTISELKAHYRKKRCCTRKHCRKIFRLRS